jgi:LemA protein
MIGLIFLIFIGLILLYFIMIYNNIVILNNNINKAWSNIDVLLKQRFNELPKLIDTVKGYSIYEKNILLDIAKIRSNYENTQNINELAKIDNQTNRLIHKSFITFEKYPKLKADKHFLELQKRISAIENMISDRREFYNDCVNVYNIKIEQIPYNSIAKIFKYKQKELFVVKKSEKENSKTTF